MFYIQRINHSDFILINMTEMYTYNLNEYIVKGIFTLSGKGGQCVIKC